MFLSVLSLLACGSPSGDDSATPAGFDFSSGDATAGETVFGNTCINCHGATGDQGTDINGTPAADLNVRVPAMTDEAIAAQVQNGGSAMPAQGLDDTDTADVVAYVRATFGG